MPRTTLSLAIALAGCGTLLSACLASTPAVPSAAVPASAEATLAQIYFWRALPGREAEYTRYVRDVAEPIDREAQRAGAFVDVTTFVASDSTLPWTHMRVFLLRDSTQLDALAAALTAAGARVQPDTAKRRMQSEYSATLRQRVGATVARILK